MATRNHVAMAAWSMQKSDMSGLSGIDWPIGETEGLGSAAGHGLLDEWAGGVGAKTSKTCCKPDQGPRTTVHLHGETGI